MSRRPGRPPLVIGCGPVATTSGLDLFVRAADVVIHRLGQPEAQFVWIGRRYDPLWDMACSMWIDDQWRRSGLPGGLIVLDPGSPAAAEALAAADLIFLPARFDPPPPEIRPALRAGTPNVAFAGTETGDLLAPGAATAAGIVPHGDPDAAAAAIAAILADPAQRAAMSEETTRLTQEDDAARAKAGARLGRIGRTALRPITATAGVSLKAVRRTISFRGIIWRSARTVFRAIPMSPERRLSIVRVVARTIDDARDWRTLPRLVGLPVMERPARYTKPGGRPYDPAKRTILLVCHEASLTGAPLLGWTILTRLNQTHNVVTLVLRGGGALSDHLAEASVKFLGAPAGRPRQAFLTGHLDALKIPIDFAIVNSIESRPILPTLNERGIPSVVLVHEFANYVRPAEDVEATLNAAGAVVFPADLVRDAALAASRPRLPRNIHVFPQGPSTLPPRDREPPGTVTRLVRGGNDARPVIIGAGSVEVRKGVDLFLTTAQIVLRRLGPGKIRFVWIGGGYKPFEDPTYYSTVLEQQLTDSAFGDDVAILPPVRALDDAYAAASVFFLPSRLDPFPNVAMDAMIAGLPVICFDRASGIAELIGREGEAARAGLVPYLDVTAAADAVIALTSDPDRHRAVADDLRRIAAATFDIDRYVERLLALAAEATAVKTQETADIATLTADPTFDRRLYTPENTPRPDAIRRHVRLSAAGAEAIASDTRRPASGFNPQAYRAAHSPLDQLPYENPLAAYLRAGKPAGPWTYPVLDVTAPAAPLSPAPRVAIHFHCPDPADAEPFLTHLRPNRAAADLLITTPSESNLAPLRAAFAPYRRGTVTIRVTPDRGRDLAPLLTALRPDLAAYDIVAHLHPRPAPPTAKPTAPWRDPAYDHLLGGKHAALDAILSAMVQNPKLGLVFPEDPTLVGWGANADEARALLARLAIKTPLPPFPEFPVGTEFIARVAALRPPLDLALDWPDYPAEPLPPDGTLLHALERLLPLIAAHTGQTWSATRLPRR